MKFPSPRHENSRFSGSLRYYHRAGSQAKRTWEEWVDGTPPTAKRSRNWWKISGYVIAALALLGIIAGLIIELR